MASTAAEKNKYRSYPTEEEVKNTHWTFGAPPNYEVVDKLFEEGRTNIWPPGSLEEKVQNLVKTWEMEMLHKANTDEIKTCDTEKFTFSTNGKKALTLEEIGKLGGNYNAHLQTSLPENLRFYNPAVETMESSHRAFTTTFPRGFALEVLRVYSGPPVIVYKFRHWGYMEGPFKGHAPTGERVEFFGIAIFELDEHSRIVKVEFFHDRGELLGGLMKGIKSSDDSKTEISSSCPFLKNTGAEKDKYRSYPTEEEVKNTHWRFGAPPDYDVVNKLFEKGRTNIWPKGSLEEKVQNLVKTWEMEMFHKANPDDYKTCDPEKFRFSTNGKKALTLKEIGKIGGYNAFLQTSLPENLRFYNPDEETGESSHRAFTTTFPRGFALEILRVYSGPPVIVYKFRHWGYMEGPFKGHAPTGERVEFYGIAIFELDEHSRVVKVEFFYDRGELLGGLMKGITSSDDSKTEISSSCPFLKNTG